MTAQSRRNKTVERISYADERVLHALFDFHYLTAEQLTRMLYSRTSLNYAREQLKRLYDLELLGRTYGPRSQAAGSTPWVYFLARKGLNHFKDHGFEVTKRYRPSEERSHSEQFLFHTLAINDFLLAARLLERDVEGVTIDGMRHDLDLKRHPVKLETGKVDIATGERELESISPDGWIHFRVAVPERDKPLPLPLLLELDRNTETMKQIKQKIRGLITYIGKPYQQLFGIDAVTVVFAVEAAACRSEEAASKRRADLVRWIEETLHDAGMTDWADLFLVTILPRGDALNPYDFFLGRSALQPFSDLPLSLLDLPDSVPITGTHGMSKPFPTGVGTVR